MPDWMPIRAFRQHYALPDDFGVALFAPKSFADLARLDQAADALNGLRAFVLAVIPPHLPDDARADQTLDACLAAFTEALQAANGTIGLNDDQFDFARAGYGDACRAVWFALWRAQALHQTAPDIPTVYRAWVEATLSRSSVPTDYTHGALHWQVVTLSDVYGRVGLAVRQADASVTQVADAVYRCPAANFMDALICQTMAQIAAARFGAP